MTDFYRARLVAIDNWSLVQSTLTTQGDRVKMLADALGISELGAYSVLAILDSPPARGKVEAQLWALHDLRVRLGGVSSAVG